MPRVQINYLPQTDKTDQSVSSGGEQVETGTVLNVNWLTSPHGDGHVQVSMEAHLSYLRLALESPNGETSPEHSLLWSPVLTRAEVNQFIKALRRARDAAYGRDE